jgi:hypothetical protein
MRVKLDSLTAAHKLMGKSGVKRTNYLPLIIFRIMPKSTYMESKNIMPTLDAECRVSIDSECGVRVFDAPAIN